MKTKILTLFLTKDESTFIRENYERVKYQKEVDQDIYVISAKPIHIENNLVIQVPQNLPVPLRIGLSIRAALRKINLKKYTHIFKIDGDIKIPLDYLCNLLKKGTPVAGIGPALLISVSFFIRNMSGEYPINYCDDGYISALYTSITGKLPPGYDGDGVIETLPNPVSREIEFPYGIEYYKWGLPLKILLLNRLLFAINNPLEGVKSIVYCTAGYISASVNKIEHYGWWKNYANFSRSPFCWKIYLSKIRKLCPQKRMPL
ncbi:MAG: hypothetical protein ACTSYM_12785 [Candidatus Baldrarchaeia archaeon]